ncbi:uncharacterized protein EDB91DRAFT_1254649 [Suillus paluster]|uniref:uncharacterized protein n=1 Tax=Suillus paluster TaxID=48578 RepID=UPI001B85B372|nr:uncharacterized protein EDB91DRAFT_1254649 [Suillus paluster]KAG1725709.1 hypothetical protein EDB91DRAFT_1254649 [Suillus paluster]
MALVKHPCNIALDLLTPFPFDFPVHDEILGMNGAQRRVEETDTVTLVFSIIPNASALRNCNGHLRLFDYSQKPRPRPCTQHQLLPSPSAVVPSSSSDSEFRVPTSSDPLSSISTSTATSGSPLLTSPWNSLIGLNTRNRTPHAYRKYGTNLGRRD